MKVDRKLTEPPPPQPKVSFRAVMKLKPGAPAPIKGPKTLSRPLHVQGQRTAAQTLTTARQACRSESSRLANTRASSSEHDEGLVELRTRRLIAHELSNEAKPTRPPAAPAETTDVSESEQSPSAAALGPTAANASSSARPATAVPNSTVEAAMELIQKIEVLLKGQRPGLSLTVGGGLSAEVTVEKTGHRSVSLNIRGTRGPVDPAKLELVQRQMAARGLSVTSLTVA